jgi:hypothetical protein
VILTNSHTPMTVENMGNDLSVAAGTGGSMNAALDLDALVDNLTTGEFVEVKTRRGRKGQATALVEKLLAGEIVDVYVVDNGEIVSKLKEKGFFAYTELGALNNSINKRVPYKYTRHEPKDPRLKELGVILYKVKKA